MQSVSKQPTVVYCGGCGMANPATNKFCYGCGASLFSQTCSFCSAINPQHATFCGSCGRKLSST